MSVIIKRTSILLGLIIILIIIFKLDLLDIGKTFSISLEDEKDTTVITEKIEQLCTLATVKYHYHEIMTYSNNMKLGEMELPFIIGGKKMLITYRAYVNGGSQFIGFEEVAEDHAKVYLSKGQILDNVLDLDSVNVYDVQQGIFNKFNLNDDTILIKNDMDEYVEANKEEIIKTAERNAEELIKGFMESLGYMNTEIIF
ncbi:MAG: DUF4230 domain-containing protein [Dehalobacterium sp.]